MIDYIPEMIEAGINSFKIEGRMKTALYVAVVTRTYRQAIDDYFTSEELYRSRKTYYDEEISACTFRQFTTGFYFGKTDENSQIYDNNTYIKNYTYLGTIEDITEGGLIVIHQKNKFLAGDEVNVMLYDGTNAEVRVEAIYDERMSSMESAPHPKQLLYIKFSDNSKIEKGMIIRSKHCEV